MIGTKNTPAYTVLAEDDHDDFFIFEKAVRELPFAIELGRAENGNVLMDMLHARTPDLLFLDIMMPCKDGMQCIKEIRSYQKFDALPIIVYSSIQGLQEIQAYKQEGANGFVHKPSSALLLKEALLEIFAIDWHKSTYPFGSPENDFFISPQ